MDFFIIIIICIYNLWFLISQKCNFLFYLKWFNNWTLIVSNINIFLIWSTRWLLFIVLTSKDIKWMAFLINVIILVSVRISHIHRYGNYVKMFSFFFIRFKHHFKIFIFLWFWKIWMFFFYKLNYMIMENSIHPTRNNTMNFNFFFLYIFNPNENTFVSVVQLI